MSQDRFLRVLDESQTAELPRGINKTFTTLAISTLGLTPERFNDLLKQNQLFQEIKASEAAGVPLSYFKFLKKLYEKGEKEVRWEGADNQYKPADLLKDPSLVFGKNAPLMIEFGKILDGYNVDDWNNLRMHVPMVEWSEDQGRTAYWEMPKGLTERSHAGRDLLRLLGESFYEAAYDLSKAAFKSTNTEFSLKDKGPLEIASCAKLGAFDCLDAIESHRILRFFPDKYNGPLTKQKLSVLTAKGKF
jgi:hypothetical protein